MLKRIAARALVATTTMLCASAAMAGPKVDRAVLDLTSTGRLIAIAEDGQTFSRLANESGNPLKFKGSLDVKMSSGELNAYSIFVGVCGGGLCGTSAFKKLHSNSFSDRKELKENVSFELSADQIPQGLSNNVQAASIFRVCNEKAVGKSADHSFTHLLRVTLGLGFAQNKDTTGIDWFDERPVQVKVICRATNPIPKPVSIDLRVTQKGETCPKETEVRALIEYRQKATARFRFKVDGKLSDLHEIKARKVDDRGPTGLGTFLVERIKIYHLDPGNHNFRIVMEDGEKSAVKTVSITCPPFKVNSMWLTYDVQDKGYCPKNVKEKLKMKATRPGNAQFHIKTQAGTVVHSGLARFERKGMEYVAVEKRKLSMSAFDSDMMAEIEDDPSANSGWTHLTVECLKRLKAELTVRDTTASTKCPRKGSVKVKLGFNMFKEKVRYRVDCTGNRSWTRDTISKKSRSGPDFGVTDYLDFDVKKTEQVNCALKDMYDGGKVIAVAGHNFKCVIQTQDTPDDMTQDTLPPEAPSAPPHTGSGKVVIDPPREPRKPQLDFVNPVKPDKSDGKTTDSTPDHGKPGGKGVSDVTPDYGKKTRYDEEADKKRLEALKRKQALKARKEAEARRKRAEAAKKAAEEARRKRAEAAKKAAEEARRKRAEAAKKAAEEARRKRAEAAKKAAKPKSGSSKKTRRKANGKAAKKPAILLAPRR